ncbi:MAG: hypothetical protein ACK46Y_04735 [Fluviicola sp.]
MLRTLVLIFVLSIIGCKSSNDLKVVKPSENITKLSKYVNLKSYKPLKVKWIYEKQGGPSNSRVPGPSDYKLEAVLFFDKATIKELKENYSLLSVSLLPSPTKGQYKFEWLDQNIIKKLNNKNLMNYNSYFFNNGNTMDGTFTIVDDGIVLLTLFTK